MSDKEKISPEENNAGFSDTTGTAEKNETAEEMETEGTVQETEIKTDTAAEEKSEAEISSEEVTQPEKAGFRDKIKGAETLVSDLMADSSIVARLIGLFMIFSSAVRIINYRKDGKINPFDARLGDSCEINGWQDYCSSVSLRNMIVFIVLGFAAVTLLRRFVPAVRKINTDGYILITGVMMFGVSALWRVDTNTFYSVYSFGITAVALIVLTMFIKTEKFEELKKIPKTVFIVIMIMCAVLVGGYVAWTTISKHKIFYTAVYDLGIFTQMYYSIINHFTLDTTCERGYELSHFAVHFSPIYYVLAPLYFIFPKAETLLAAQAVLAVSGFIPLYLICRKYRFSDIVSFLFTLVYIFSTSVMMPCYYEFHENAFLPPLLMWFFYAIEKENKVLMYIMMVLVLMVKEDAALYIMCISLYLVFSGRNRKHGTIMFLATAAVFVNVLSLMAKYGEGAMTNRTFGNLMQNYDGGFGEVIKTALTNPMYFIQQCFANDKLEKFVFIFVMLLPLLFMPFITKKASRLFLVVPFIVMNLASGYAYAAKFDFQYVFGTSVCLIYAALINTADLDRKIMNRLVPMMAAASVFIFTANATNKLYYTDVYKNYKENIDRKDAYCEAIPEDASLLATSFLIPHCANRDELYVLDEGSSVNPDTTDFVIFEDGQDEWKIKKREMLEAEGYTVWNEAEGIVVIYVSPYYEFKS